MATSLAQLRKSARAEPKKLTDMLAGINKIVPEGFEPEPSALMETSTIAPTPSAAPSAPKEEIFSSGNTQFYTNFGGGAININGRNYNLPLTTSDEDLILAVRLAYNVGAVNSPIKMRIV